MNTVSGVMYIDGVPHDGTLTLDQNWIDVSTRIESRPDPSWEFIDAAGHFHAWGDDGKVPTLTTDSVHVPCGGDCDLGERCEDGHTTDEYLCLICDEQVHPRWIVNTDPPRRQIPGRVEWTAEVWARVDGTVSVVIGPYVGIGQAVQHTVSSTDGVTTRLVCGPMAKRLTDPAAPAK